MHRTVIFSVLILMVGFVACTPANSVTSLPPTSAPLSSTATPRPPLEQHLRQAFQAQDPLLRRQRVLDATDSFLRNEQISTTDDAIAARYYADIAFSSGRLTLPYPVYLRRYEDAAVIALPEGLGVHLYDLSQPTGTSPITVSEWAVGVTSLDVIWHERSGGIIFTTEDDDQQTRIHYALAVRAESGWTVTWFSDETPDWWFNAVGGTLEFTENLSSITVTGGTTTTTNVFLDNESLVERIFALHWVREGNTYILDPSPDTFPSRRAWLWRVARPSAYATLVEFIERLQYGKPEGLQRLIVSSEVLEAVDAFGLARGDRRYQIVSAETDQVIFRDLQGTFIATFEPPTAPGEPWRILRIEPPGVPGPTATPES